MSAETQDEADERMARSLEQALRYHRGDRSGVTIYRVDAKVPDVVKLRADVGLTQDELADRIGVPVATLRNWEQKRRVPTGPARVLLNILERDPSAVMGLIASVERAQGGAGK